MKAFDIVSFSCKGVIDEINKIIHIECYKKELYNSRLIGKIELHKFFLNNKNEVIICFNPNSQYGKNVRKIISDSDYFKFILDGYSNYYGYYFSIISGFYICYFVKVKED